MNSNVTFRSLVLALTLTGAVLTGCASSERGSGAERELPVNQTHSFEVVQLRAQDLRDGMTRAEVFLLLGSPAEYRGDTWVYRNERDELKVTFRDNRYAGHRGP